MDYSRFTFRDVNIHAKGVVDLHWNADGTMLGTVAADKTVKISQLESNGGAKMIHTIPCTTHITKLCWHPSDAGKFCLVGDDKNVDLWDVRASRASTRIASLGYNINCAWSPCSHYLAVGNRSDNLAIFDMRTNKMVKKSKFNYEVNELVWTANSDYLITATGGGDVGCIDLLRFTGDDLVLVDSLAGHCSNCIYTTIDSSRTRLAVGSADYSVSLWDINDMVCHHSFPMDTDIKAISYSGDGKQIAIIGEKEVVHIVDSNTAEELGSVVIRSKMISLAWHPKLPIIALATEEKGPMAQYLRLLSFE